jgi:hypothetical protein
MTPTPTPTPIPIPIPNATQLESLEARRLLAQISLQDGTLTVAAVEPGENIGVVLLNAEQNIVRAWGSSGEPPTTADFDLDEVPISGIVLIGGDEGQGLTVDDELTIPSTISGGGGDDYIGGSSASDFLDGGDGNDLIWTNAGSDVALGGAGGDQIEGQAGDDELFGNDGNDTIFGADGSDYISGGADSDELHGGSDPDNVFGDWGDDYVWLEDGSFDHAEGGVGYDRLCNYDTETYWDEGYGGYGGWLTRPADYAGGFEW